MSRILAFALVTAISLVPRAAQAAVTPIYLNVNIHNEESAPDPDYTDSTTYAASREWVRQLADTVSAHGAAFNFQSDWRFLLGCIRFDHGTLSTNGKSLIRWMSEDRGIEIDPHSHHLSLSGASAFTYTIVDDAKLIDSLGVPPSLNVGGFVTLDTTWQALEKSSHGKQFPAYSWWPKALWGAGSPDHRSDVNTYGAWNPKSGRSMIDFMTHAPAQRLTLIGNGCSTLIADTTQVGSATSNLVQLIGALHGGGVPAGQFYSATLQMNVRDLNATAIARLGQILTALQPYIDSGDLVWMRLSDKYATWLGTYASAPQYLLCGGVTTDVESPREEAGGGTALWLTTRSDGARVEFGIGGAMARRVRLELLDARGRRIALLRDGVVAPGRYSLPVADARLASGLYFCRLQGDGDIRTARLLRLP